MLIKFLKEVIPLEDSLSFEQKLTMVAELIEKAGISFSHLVVDGQMCDHDYTAYLASLGGEIRQIEVIVKPMTQMMAESVTLTRDYLERAIPEIEILANELYHSKTKEMWEKLVQFIEGLQWLLKVAGYFQDQPMNDHFQTYHQFSTAIQNRLEEFETALAGSDQVLLADLLTYELLPALETLRHNLEKDGCGEAADGVN